MKDPHTDERLSLHVRLLGEAAAGHLDNLECPTCRKAAVSVWFTHPSEDEYRTWFICDDCGFHTRTQNTERPQFFTEDRVSSELEERDLAILKNLVFKKPPQRFM